MTLSNNTILITGGSSGIGLQLAKSLVADNQVIICGRSMEKLEQAQKALPEVIIKQCDLSKVTACQALAKWVQAHYPDCNVLINNAAIVHCTNFYEDDNMVQKAEVEINTNLLAPIALTKYMIPVLERNARPTLINITTGLIYAPKTTYPIYNATKSALHAFTQILRGQMQNHTLSIVEVLFPAVDTPWHNGNPPGFAISPKEAVDEMLKKMKQGKREIKIGKVRLLYILSRIAPGVALGMINGK